MIWLTIFTAGPSAEKADAFDSLCERIMFQQFKNTIHCNLHKIRGEARHRAESSFIDLGGGCNYFRCKSKKLSIIYHCVLQLRSLCSFRDETGVCGHTPVIVDPDVGSGFELIITDAVVSLVGSDNRVLIKWLHDTGARHTFIVESVLPFFSQYSTSEWNGDGLNSGHNMTGIGNMS